MRSDTKPLNSVALDLLQRKNQIACRHCCDTVVGKKGRTVLDDSGTLAITAWTCARCGGVIEEVRIMVQGRKAQPRPIRYAVGSTALDRTAGAGCALRAQELKQKDMNKPTGRLTPDRPVGILHT